MTRLFIIGNGFDIAHGLPTKYSDFQKYLLSMYPDAQKTFPSFSIDSTLMPDGEEVFDKDEAVGLIMDVISETIGQGNDWSDLETNLGRLNFDRYFDDMSILSNPKDDNDLFKMAYRYEDVSNNFLKVFVKIKNLFPNWVNSIDVLNSSPKTSFKKIIDKKNDLFLNFNYTSVLEDLYNVENICYIHGMQDNEIIFGHGEEKESFENIYTGSEFALAELHSLLKKDTSKIIKESNYFFAKLSSVKSIYSYGFSFSKVDLPYIREICKNCNTKECTWYLQGHEPARGESEDEFKQKIKSQKERIESCGFEGKFNVFNI